MAFNNFPYTNAHELNLDYILNATKDAKEKVDGFSDEIAALHEEDENLSNRIGALNVKFDNMDYQDAVNEKIDLLIESGEFAAQISNLRVTPNYQVFRQLTSSQTVNTDFGIVFCGDSIMGSTGPDDVIVSDASKRMSNRLYYHWRTMLLNKSAESGNITTWFQMAWGGARTSTEGIEWLRQYKTGIDGTPWKWLAPDDSTVRYLTGQGGNVIKPAAIVWNMGANDIGNPNYGIGVLVQNLTKFILFCIENDIAPFVFTPLPLNSPVTDYSTDNTTRTRRTVAKIIKNVCTSYGVLCCNACEKYDELVGGGIAQGKLIPPTNGNYAHLADYRPIADAIAADIFPPSIVSVKGTAKVDVAQSDGVFNNGTEANPFETYTTGIYRYLKIYNSSRVAIHVYLSEPSFLSIHGLRTTEGGTLQITTVDSLGEQVDTPRFTFDTSGASGGFNAYVKTTGDTPVYKQFPAGYYRIELQCVGGGNDDSQYALVDSLVVFPVGSLPGWSRPSPTYLSN